MPVTRLFSNGSFEKSPIYTSERPIYIQKSHTYIQKSPIYITHIFKRAPYIFKAESAIMPVTHLFSNGSFEKSPIHPPERPMYIQESPMYIQKNPTYIQSRIPNDIFKAESRMLITCLLMNGKET